MCIRDRLEPLPSLKLFHEEGPEILISLLSYGFEFSGEQLRFHRKNMLQLERVGLLSPRFLCGREDTEQKLRSEQTSDQSDKSNRLLQAELSAEGNHFLIEVRLRADAEARHRVGRKERDNLGASKLTR